MSNLAETPAIKDPEETPKEKPDARPVEVVDMRTRKILTPEEVKARKREHPSWPVTIGEGGVVLGLPEGVSQKDVILFKGPEGNWWAQNPSEELLEEIRLWRTDWQDV